MKSQIPNVIKPLLYEYQQKLKNYFGDKVYGVYLYNSVALGGFDEKKSDIDFITVLNEEFEDKDIPLINEIHNDLINKYRHAARMEGMYLHKSKIGKLNSEIKPYLYFCNGKLQDYGYYDVNCVTWWTLKHNGIAVNSPGIDILNIDVDWNKLLKTMDYNLNEYWKEKLDEKDIFVQDEWVEFAVLTLCRIFYTLENKKIATKLQSVQYSLENVPQKYKLIIQEGIRLRGNYSNNSLYKTAGEREKALKVFIKYMINYCNENYDFY